MGHRRLCEAGPLLLAVPLLLAGLLLVAARPAAAQAPAPAPVSYTVQPGDTLFSIAERFGTTVEAIVRANGIADPALIAVGQKLSIPPAGPAEEPAPRTYVVQPGDTLLAIALRFGTTARAITEANSIPDPSFLEIGQRLVIPEAPEELEGVALSTRRLHTVVGGETLPFLAFRYGTTIRALREANGLGRLCPLLPGQELEIPAPLLAGPATPQRPTLSIVPAAPAQGQTVAVRVSSPAELALSGQLLGQELDFRGRPGLYWALVGVDPLTPAAGYTLTLEAVEEDTGDRLRMEQVVSVAAGSFATVNIVVPADRLGLLDPGLSRAESAKVADVFALVSGDEQWGGSFGYPLAEVVTTAAFGQRRSYAGGPVSSYHSGQDLGASSGTPVYAPAAGTVALAEPLQVRGNAIILDHGAGVLSGYWHLSQIDVAVGQAVARGAPIGLVGNTGLSNGPHLHWEIRVHGVPVDPLQWTRQEFP